MRFIIVVVTISLLSTLAGAGKVYHYDYQKIISVEPTLELTIKNANGNVVITTNNEYQLKIDAVKNIYADSKDEADLVADHVQINATSTEGHYTIEPRFLKIHNRSPSFWQKLLGKSGEPSYGSVDFVISVPTDCNADINNTSGNIDLAGMRGKLSISGTAGDVSVRDNHGEIEITTTSGKVEINDVEGNVHIIANGSDIEFFSITGDLEIRNSSGRTTGEYLIGDLIMSQTTGTIGLKHIEGDIRIKSTSGKVDIGQDFGALDVSSESGDITVKTELNSPKDYFVETISGSVRFMIPEASGGRIKLEAGSGDIRTKVPIMFESFSKTRISGSFGNGGPKISLITSSGEITLAEY